MGTTELILAIITLMTTGGGLASVINVFNNRKTTKQRLSIDEMQNKKIESIENKLDEIFDFMTKSKKQAQFPLKMITFYNSILEEKNVSEEMKVAYQSAINLVIELHRELSVADIENVTFELFEIALKNKVRLLYDVFINVTKKDKTQADVVQAKNIVRSEIKRVLFEFKKIKIQYKNGELLQHFGEILYTFSTRTINKLTTFL